MRLVSSFGARQRLSLSWRWIANVGGTRARHHPAEGCITDSSTPLQMAYRGNEMTFETSRRIAVEHPSLAGHFPNAPIVPGVVVLDEVAAALAEWRKGSLLVGIPFIKFLAPIKPGQQFTIAFEAPDNAQIDFCCRMDGRVVVEGRLEISCGACI